MSSFVGARPMTMRDNMVLDQSHQMVLDYWARRNQDKDRRRQMAMEQQKIDEDARQANMADQRFYDGQSHDAAKTSFLADVDSSQKQEQYAQQRRMGGMEAGWAADRDSRLAGFQSDRDVKYQQFLTGQNDQESTNRLGEIEHKQNMESEQIAEGRRQQLKSNGYDYSERDKVILNKLENDEANLRSEFAKPGGQIREKAFYETLNSIRQQKSRLMPSVQVKSPQDVQKERWDSMVKTDDGRLVAWDAKGTPHFSTASKAASAGGAVAGGFDTHKGQQFLLKEALDLHKTNPEIPLADALKMIREGAASFSQGMGSGGATAPAVPLEIQEDLDLIRNVNGVYQRGGQIGNPLTIEEYPKAKARVDAWRQHQQQQQQQPAVGPAPQGMMPPQSGPPQMMGGPRPPMPQQGGMVPQDQPMPPGNDPFVRGPVGPQTMRPMPSAQRSIADAAVRTMQGMREGDVAKVIQRTPAAEMVMQALRNRQPQYQEGGAVAPAANPDNDSEVIERQQQLPPDADDRMQRRPAPMPRSVDAQTEAWLRNQQKQIKENPRGVSDVPMSVRPDEMKQWRGLAQKSGDIRVESIVNLADQSKDPEVIKSASIFMRSMKSGKPPEPGTRDYYLLGHAIGILERAGVDVSAKTKPKKPNPGGIQLRGDDTLMQSRMLQGLESGGP